MEREYSVNFGQCNTWSDWHLTPAERPIVVPPTEKTHNIDLPGGSGVIDAAQALTGYPVFNMREGSWDFYVENDIEPFMTIYSKVMAALQGKRLRVSLEEDAAYFYEGRCWVDNPKQSNGHTMLTINYSFNPYKHKFADIGKVVKIAVNGSATIFSGSVSNYTGEPICPKLGIELSSGNTMSIEFTTSSRRYTTSLAKGTWVDPIIMLIPGETTSIVAKGYGTVSLQAIGGWL